jgi:hypothetical protein
LHDQSNPFLICDEPAPKKPKLRIKKPICSDDRYDIIREKFYKKILAPMVGASELAFRLLCRKYGATLAYTPMMSSDRFAVDPSYREEEFQTVPADRPLVAHFSANNPEVFLAAAKHVENHCDAIGDYISQTSMHDPYSFIPFLCRPKSRLPAASRAQWALRFLSSGGGGSTSSPADGADALDELIYPCVR